MNSLIQALGLDLRILLAQLFNFAILIFILWRFAYKPVFNILEERRQKIAKGISDSDEAGLRLQKSTEDSKEIISNSRREASDIIEGAQKKAEVKYQEIVASAQDDIKKQSNLEMSKIKKEKDALISEVKAEVSELVVLSLEKFLKEKMDGEKDKKIIEKIVKELS